MLNIFLKPVIAMAASFCLLGIFAQAHADTTVYIDSTTQTRSPNSWGATTNGSEADGASDGISATMAHTGWIAWQTDTYTDYNATFDFSNISPNSTVYVYAGRTDPANGWFTNLRLEAVTSFTNGVNEFSSATLTAHCVSIGGCDMILLYNASGQPISIDTAALTSDFVSAAPEPATWAMMMIGFILVAARLKASRKRKIAGIDMDLKLARI